MPVRMRRARANGFQFGKSSPILDRARTWQPYAVRRFIIGFVVIRCIGSSPVRGWSTRLFFYLHSEFRAEVGRFFAECCAHLVSSNQRVEKNRLVSGEHVALFQGATSGTREVIDRRPDQR